MTTDTPKAADAASEAACVRLLRRMARPGAHALPGQGGAVSLQLGVKGASTVEVRAWERAIASGWVAADETGSRWGLTASGRRWLKRALSSSGIEAPARSGRTHAPEPSRMPGFNASESPLGWLSTRRDRDGRPLISPEQLAAGERLRVDFTFAQMSPRVTACWSPTAATGAGRRSAPGAGVDIQDSVVAAGERVRLALKAVGPELAGVLLDVCCHLKGLEDAERAQGWPQRSGKVVLGLALTRLARHYGLTGAGRGGPAGRAAPIRHWGSDDFRPTLASWE